MGKLLIFIAAFKAGLFGLLTVAVIGVVVSIYYYFGWIKAAFFETGAAPLADSVNAKPTPSRVSLTAGIALGALALSSIILGFYQGPFGQWLTTR